MNAGRKMWIFVLYITGQLLQGALSTICNLDVKDPLWPQQWYLNKSATDLYDMNVLPAWRNCINGTGVTVGVVDKGVQDHIDLNVNRRLDFDNTGTGDVNSYKHGTRVAGVIAAKMNFNFSVGIAFGSEIADVKIASEAVFETFSVSSFTHRMDVIDIYSCSFANFHTGTKTYPLLKEQEDAFRTGTTQGRGGLGSIYVFATGNSGGDETSIFTDSCAYDRLVTNRYVISVAGVQSDLSKVPNGEGCSAMLVAAFTASGGAQHHRLITTDIGNTSTEFFNQNSAATPMVSGAVALALSANPKLTYRDVMHLLVHTSRGNLPEFRDYFMKNAADLSVSSYFGFGLLDIGALVERSRVWSTVPQYKSCRVHVNDPKPLGSVYHIVLVENCDISYAEHVEVTLNINHQDAGRVQWVLISPYGTKSIILPGRALDSQTNMSLTVLSVQMWGENPHGYWRLEPTAVFDKSLDGGTVTSFGLIVHGFNCTGYHMKCLNPAKQDPSVFTTPGPDKGITTNDTDKSEEETNNMVAVIIGIVIGGIVLMSVIVVVLYIYKNKMNGILRSENGMPDQHIPLNSQNTKIPDGKYENV